MSFVIIKCTVWLHTPGSQDGHATLRSSQLPINEHGIKLLIYYVLISYPLIHFFTKLSLFFTFFPPLFIFFTHSSFHVLFTHFLYSFMFSFLIILLSIFLSLLLIYFFILPLFPIFHLHGTPSRSSHLEHDNERPSDRNVL
jgi:hypothetical protein